MKNWSFLLMSNRFIHLELFKYIGLGGDIERETKQYSAVHRRCNIDPAIAMSLPRYNRGRLRHDETNRHSSIGPLSD